MKASKLVLAFILLVSASEGATTVAIIGGVYRPGTYHLEQSEGLLDLIEKSGGLRVGCGGNEIKILTKDIKGKEVIHQVDPMKVIENGTDFALQENSLIVIMECVAFGLGGLTEKEVQQYNQAVAKFTKRKNKKTQPLL
jgi:hypothetical protein